MKTSVDEAIKMNPTDIVNYIGSEYTNSCIAANGYSNLNAVDAANESLKFFIYEKLGICGCGSPEDTLLVIRDLLDIIYEYSQLEFSENNYEEKWHKLNSLSGTLLNTNKWNGILQFILYILDDRGFLEHGGSIGGAWLSAEGIMLRNLLHSVNMDEIFD